MDGPGFRFRWSERALLMAAICAAVIGTDQATKWLAWRHIDGTVINQGGYILFGRHIRSWFAAPTSGAVLNGIGAALVAATMLLLVWRGARLRPFAGAAMVAAGWASNLLDRFGLHEWTAPGSPRGVVDFIPSGGSSRGNVADLWITAGVLLLAGHFAVERHRRRAP